MSNKNIIRLVESLSDLRHKGDSEKTIFFTNKRLTKKGIRIPQIITYYLYIERLQEDIITVKKQHPNLMLETVDEETVNLDSLRGRQVLAELLLSL